MRRRKERRKVEKEASRAARGPETEQPASESPVVVVNDDDAAMSASPKQQQQQAPPPTTSWITYFAILGDSSVSLLLSFLLLLFSIALSRWMDPTDSTLPADHYESLGPIPWIDPPRIYTVPPSCHLSASCDISLLVTDEMRRAFEKDGVVAMRGLIDPQLMERLDRESQELVNEQLEKNRGRKRRGTQFHTVSHGAIFRNPPTKAEPDSTKQRKVSAFLEVSVQSLVPRIAAALLNQGERETIRVMRDIFLAKDEDEYICGWHVDDFGFWPAMPEAPGVNAWIAVDDMPVHHGGGFALALGSHHAPWRDKAHHVTGATTTFPREGFRDARDMFSKRTGSGTCNLKQAAPHLHRRMEETKRIYETKRGDVIFHTRWLFHRTVPFNRTYVDDRESSEDLIYRRYSVRYGPGSSIIPPGYGTELSVLWNDANGGRTADDVNRLDGPWYPQAWPPALDDATELDRLAALVERKMPTAVKRREQRKKEMKPFLKKLAKEQHRFSTHGQ